MEQFRIDGELFRAIPADLMLRYGFVPYRRDGKSLVIVVSDPRDLPLIDELAALLGTPVKVTVGAPSARGTVTLGAPRAAALRARATVRSSSAVRGALTPAWSNRRRFT